MSISRFKFRRSMGEFPKYDDLERVNCAKEGEDHKFCGWCDNCDKPRMQCGCKKGKP